LPNYWELRRGTADFPIVLQAADGRGTAILRGDVNMAMSSFVYFVDLNVEPDPAGDTIHLERCDHVLIRGCRLNGDTWPPAGCGSGGYTAGQGTGFQFMVSPWLHYETYDLKVVNNVIHDVEGAGLGANGSYNALFAYNTVYRSGTRDHLIELGYGARGCDGVAGQPPDPGCVANLGAAGC